MNERSIKCWVALENAALRNLHRLASRFHHDRRGAGVAEYGMVVGLAVVFGLFILKMFWGEDDSSGLRKVFVTIVAKLDDMFTGTPGHTP